jgi:hypothetical protein
MKVYEWIENDSRLATEEWIPNKKLLALKDVKLSSEYPLCPVSLESLGWIVRHCFSAHTVDFSGLLFKKLENWEPYFTFFEGLCEWKPDLKVIVADPWPLLLSIPFFHCLALCEFSQLIFKSHPVQDDGIDWAENLAFFWPRFEHVQELTLDARMLRHAPLQRAFKQSTTLKKLILKGRLMDGENVIFKSLSPHLECLDLSETRGNFFETLFEAIASMPHPHQLKSIFTTEYIPLKTRQNLKGFWFRKESEEKSDDDDDMEIEFY